MHTTHSAAQDAEMSLAEFEDLIHGSTFADSINPIAASSKYHAQ